MNLSRKLSLIVMVCVLSVLVPALLFFYYSSQKSLLKTEMAAIKNQTQLLVDIHRANLIANHSSLESLAGLLRRELSQAQAYAIDNFNRTMMRSDDGVWRNRHQGYDGTSEAGLFLPIDNEPTDSDKLFYGTALDLFTKYGAASTSSGIADNVWMLGHDRSELIFDLSYPDFVYLMTPDTDYTTTPWMTLASPEQNPDRVVKWTSALFDDVSKTWMISAVYPLDLDGQWRATLGHDIQLKDIFSLLYSQTDEYKGEQHIIVDNSGGFILAGPWQQQLEQNPDTFELNSNETELIQVLQQPISAQVQLQDPIYMQGRSYQVVAISMEPMGWHYLRLVPTDQVLAPLMSKTVHIGLIMIFTVFLLGVMMNVAARKLLVNPLILLTHRLRAYAQGKASPQTQFLMTNDELGELSLAIDRMHNDLTEESQQIIESERRYRRVINNVREVIVQIDSQGKWRFLSSVWKVLTGYDYRSSLNQSVVDFVHPADRELVQKTLISLVNGAANSWQGELRMMTEDKRYVWVDMSLQKNRDADNNSSALLVGTLENIHLIRLRRTINDTLRTAEQMVLASACSVDVVLDFVCNDMVRILDVDLFWIKLCQAKDIRMFSAGEGDDFLFDQRGIWSGLHESDSPVMKCVNQAEIIRVTFDSDISSTWRQRLKNDCLIDNVFLPFCFGSEIKGVIGVQTVTSNRFDLDYQNMLSNFSASLRLICQLAEDQHMMRLHQAAVEKAANAIMITNADGVIEWVNYAFERYSQYCLDEVIGQTPRFLKSSEQPKGYAKNIWQTISNGNVWQGELVNRRKDGSLVHIFQTITPLVDSEGKITHYIAIIEDISERKADQERIAFMATHDELTHLPNRSLLTDRLNQAIAQSQRHQTKMAVLFIDLDQFKIINDSLGHQIGDELLQEVATRLLSTLRVDDTVARFGGDEFVVILPEIDSVANVSHVADMLLSTLNKPYLIAGHELTVTGSIGISICPDDSVSGDVLIQHADSAMYTAKESGRNISQFYTCEINEKVMRRMSMDKALRLAITQQQFLLYYQPKINLQTNKIIGIEALIRWQHPELGLVPPVEFITLAEETGLIIPIGEWVVTTACQQMKQWLIDFPQLESMAINLSARQFQQKQFVSNMQSLIEHCDIQPEKIEFEITESLLMANVETAITILNELKALGVALSIDDFGTGYSSLSYLKRFPVDVLKIDRSFVSELYDGNADHAIVKSIIALANNLKLNVVAEGVEYQSQQDLLTMMGCHYAQGYYFSKPVSAEQLTLLLSRN